MNTTLKLSIKIIVLFSVAILSTFIGDYFHDFFGDWKCNGSGDIIKEEYFIYFKGCDYTSTYHLSTWHWGYRHYLYTIMCSVLFLIQAIDILKNATEK